MIADLSFKGCIANLIFFILLSRETAKSLFENVKKKYSKDKWDLKNVGQVVHYRTPKGPRKSIGTEHIFVMATQLHPTSANQILKIIYLIVTYHEMETKATLMIGTPVAVQKRLRNQKKKDLSKKKKEKNTNNHIPD